MSTLPRGYCPVCHREVALRTGKALAADLVREHRVYLPQLAQDPSTRLGRTRVCEGSGRPPLEAES